jgi:hypothetical protein
VFWRPPPLALIKGFPYYGCVNVTLTLDDKLVKELRKIAAERETTLTGLVRTYLEKVAAEHDSDRTRRNQERFKQTFDRFKARLDYGKRTWRREDLYDRKSR